MLWYDRLMGRAGVTQLDDYTEFLVFEERTNIQVS
jgi:hypothetical protein